MSGVNGLLGYEGCCCEPTPTTCEEDVDDFYLFGTTYPYQISIADFCARFNFGTAYFNMIGKTPYEPHTNCPFADADGDCCGGPSLTQFCCGGPCCDKDCTCNVHPCYACKECTENPLYTDCGGVQGVYGARAEPNLNVDGDGFAAYCCNCPQGTTSTVGCYSFGPGHPLFPALGCNEPAPEPLICPNQDDADPLILSGAITPFDGVFDLEYFCSVPCDNATYQQFQTSGLGYAEVNPPQIEYGSLYWSWIKMNYVDDVESTTCNTLIVRFNGTHAVCNIQETANIVHAAVFYAKKYAPTSNLVAAGNFVIGRYYKIKVVGTTNFVAIGAGANTVGTIFEATGIGAGSGTAYLARNMDEIGSFFAGTYTRRSVQTEQMGIGTIIDDYDYGDKFYEGIERATEVQADVGLCECNLSTGLCSGVSVEGSCGGYISVEYPTCYNAYTDTLPNISNVEEPAVVTITFT